MSRKPEKILVMNDLHVPFQDKPLMKKMYKFIEKHQNEFDKIFLLGDWIDFYSISRFDKDPERRLYLKKEVDMAKKELEKLREVYPKGEIWYLKGNHEERVEKYIKRNAQELYWVEGLKLEKLLDLDELDIKYINKRYFKYKGLIYSHLIKANKYGGYSARNLGVDIQNSLIHGHSHKSGKVRMGKYDFYDNGCLCKLDAEYLKVPASWTHSFAVVEVYGNESYINQIDIKNRKFIYKGVRY